MPLRGGDYNVTNYINQLEERLEARIAALEEAVAKSTKPGLTAAAVGRIVDRKLDEADEAAEAEATEAKEPSAPKAEPSRSETKEPSPPEKSRRW